MAHGDLADLSHWLAQPHVARFWCEPSEPDAVLERYGPSLDGTDPTELFIVQLAGRPIGMVQRYLLADIPEWASTLDPTGAVDRAAAGIDYLIGDPAMVGRGIGSAAIDLLSAGIFERYPEVGMIVVAVQQENLASWRALERTGYRRLWAGQLDSDDPSDSGPSYVYGRYRA